MVLAENIDLMIAALTIIAIVAGPIMAVQVSRKMEAERDRYERKMSIFRALMKTRQIQLDPDHVGALNLIELEFYDKTKVTDAYRAYIGHLNLPLPATTAQEAHYEQRSDLFVNLLQAELLPIRWTDTGVI